MSRIKSPFLDDSRVNSSEESNPEETFSPNALRTPFLDESAYASDSEHPSATSGDEHEEEEKARESRDAENDEELWEFTHDGIEPKELETNESDEQGVEAAFGEVSEYERDEQPDDQYISADEYTPARFDRIISEPAKNKPEEVRDSPGITVVDLKGEPIIEGEYAFHQGGLVERGKFSQERKGRAYFSKIDPSLPFMFEVSDRVCAIRAGAFFDPDNPEIEYGGTWFDWTLVRDDKQADKNFWPYYQREMDFAAQAEAYETGLGRRVDRFLQHEHITRRPIQVVKQFLTQPSKVRIRATPSILRVGPFVRYTDHERAVIWLETVTPNMVRVRYKKEGGGAESARYDSTVRVGGRHFAAVEIDGLEADKFYDYTVELAPLPASGAIPVAQEDFKSVFPQLSAAVVRSLKQQLAQSSLNKTEWLTFRTLRRTYDNGLRFATGSCRWYPGDKRGGKDWGPDMLHRLGDWLHLNSKEKWPHFLFFCGDQIYSDEVGDDHGEMLIRGRFAARIPGPADPSASVRDKLIDGAWAGRFAHRYKDYKDPDIKFVERIRDSLKKLDEIHRRYPDIRGIYREYPEDDPSEKLKWRHQILKGKRELGGAKGEAADEKQAREAVSLLPTVEALEISSEPFRAYLPHWKIGFSVALRRNPMGHGYLSHNFLLWSLPDFERQLPTLADQHGTIVARRPDRRGHPAAADGVHTSDFAEYAYFYERAWTSSRSVRVLLAQIPTFLMFDDHELTDDWNFDVSWVRMLHNEKDDFRMWPKTLTDGLAAYWVYQGWGNKAPSQWKSGDPRVKALDDARRQGKDALPKLRECLHRACFMPAPSKNPNAAYQTGLSLEWHYRLPFDPPFLVPDCRSRKLLVPADDKLRIIDHDVPSKSPRSQTIDDKQLAWMRKILVEGWRGGPVAFIAPSTPLLLQKKVMSFMRLPEVAAKGWAGGIDLASIGAPLLESSKLGIASDELIRVFRRAKDLEHMIRDKSWRDLWGLVEDMRKKGSPVKTLVLVSGDVHHSYSMTANLPGSGRPKPELVQITSSGLQTTIRKDFKTSLAEELSSLVFDVGKYRLVPGFVSKDDTGDPDLVLYHNTVAMVDVSMSPEVNVVVTYLAGKDKHIYRYTSGAAYMENGEPAVLVNYRRKRAVVRDHRELQHELEGHYEFRDFGSLARPVRVDQPVSLESPFLNGELFVEANSVGASTYSSRASAESPFLQGFSEDFLNPAASEDQYVVDEFHLADEQALPDGNDEETDEEWGEVEHDSPTGASPLDALSPSELKAVRITSTFETGRAGSFGGLTGNFDGQGVSFGLMNFAWKAGSLITLLKEFLRDHPAAFAEVFGPDATRFQEIILSTKPDPQNPKRRVRDLDRQMEFARNVLNDANNKIRDPWRGYFSQLEVNPHFRRIQIKAVRRAAERARYWCQYFGLKTERGFAFMFDLVSSHGGAWLNADKFKGERRKLLRAMIADKKAQVGRNALTEIELLEVIANMIADISLEKWRQKVRSRKLWFVKGSGQVHGTSWDLARDFGVTDAPPDFDREEPEQHALTDRYETEALERWPPSEGAQEETEEFSDINDESPLGEENGKIDHQPEMLECSPYADEAQQEEFGKLESNLDELYLDEAETGIEFEDEDSVMLRGVAYDARMVNNKDRTDSTPAEAALIVDRWGNAEVAKVSGARLKVYECDIGESGRSDAPTANDTQIAEFTLDLVPNPEFVSNPTKAAIPHVAVVNAKWANATLEMSYKATKKPDIILWLGERAFPLWVPREDIMEEGSAAEIGFVIEDREGHKVERMSIARGHVASVSLPDYLKVMLEIPGRFDDPTRDAAVEMDGTKFDEFLNGKNRREFIKKWLDEHPALKEAANEPSADLKTGDIIKAWFIVHDVGVGASLSDKRFKANQSETKRNAVHGFLNRAGYFAATHDFNSDRQGTVYEFLSKRGLKITGGRTINIETVPDIESGVPDKSDGSHGDPSNADQYASIGYRRVYVKGVYSKRVDYYKWTKTAFDVLADLYIFASARARHLLTITAHKEIDRNLARSVIWREYSAAEIRSGTGKHWATVRDKPSNYHGDPYGFNMQALYDLITQKLNALGGKQMPVGARYGIHPQRVCKADGEDIANGDSHLHEFPHQSNPNIKTDTGIKKSGWWNSK
jgi:hypothetical protein